MRIKNNMRTKGELVSGCNPKARRAGRMACNMDVGNQHVGAGEVGGAEHEVRRYIDGKQGWAGRGWKAVQHGVRSQRDRKQGGGRGGS